MAYLTTRPASTIVAGMRIAHHAQNRIAWYLTPELEPDHHVQHRVIAEGNTVAAHRLQAFADQAVSCRVAPLRTETTLTIPTSTSANGCLIFPPYDGSAIDNRRLLDVDGSTRTAAGEGAFHRVNDPSRDRWAKGQRSAARRRGRAGMLQCGSPLFILPIKGFNRDLRDHWAPSWVKPLTTQPRAK